MRGFRKFSLDRREVVIEGVDTSASLVPYNQLSTNFEEAEEALLQSRENTMTDGKDNFTEKRGSSFDNETLSEVKSDQTKNKNLIKSLSASQNTYENNIELFLRLGGLSSAAAPRSAL